MDLFVDASFPASIAQVRSQGLQLHRWSGERVGDLALVKEAARSAVGGVIFLGIQPLLSSAIRTAARDDGLFVAGTVEQGPFEAMRLVGNLLGSIERAAARPGCYKLLVREVRLWADLGDSIS